jgi:membrane-bound lytic murein transglycosylase F
MKFLGTIFLGILFFLYSGEKGTLLEKIKASGELQVATLYGLTTYYENVNGQMYGFEYELAKRFADELGVKLRLVVVNNVTAVFQQVINQEVHFAAAGLAVTPPRQSLVRFGPHYQQITQKFVYRYGSLSPPSRLTDLTPYHKLNVLTDSHQIDILKKLKKQYPQLTWQEWPEIASKDLLKQVKDKKLLYALANSHEIAKMRLLYPQLEIGFELPHSNRLAWAFPRNSPDNSLYLAAIEFINRLQRQGEIDQLLERYYGHLLKAKDFNYVNIRAFRRRIKKRLPLYEEHFKLMADKYDLDWHLLAAIGYQESKWNPKAVSGTGVKGLMMLTKSTAEEMGVKNRRDPYESIRGGTKYFVRLKARLPKRIQEPDRTWFTLAAYNVGLGHLRDALKLTEKLGDNPDRWTGVKEHLPKLTQPRWYNQTKYGYARGHEPVQFVTNVRRFYNILVLTNLLDKTAKKNQEKELEKKS